MRKLVITMAAVAGLLCLGAPKTDACGTHGYVRASTLNDLFANAGPDDNVVFGATNVLDGSNPPLSDVNLDTNNYEDGHAFQEGHKDPKTGQITWSTVSIFDDGKGIPGQTQIDDIISQIEQSLSESLDQNHAD